MRGSCQGLKESEGPVRVGGSQRVLSGSEGVSGSSLGLRESEGPVRFLGRQRVQSGPEGVKGSSHKVQ